MKALFKSNNMLTIKAILFFIIIACAFFGMLALDSLKGGTILIDNKKVWENIFISLWSALGCALLPFLYNKIRNRKAKKKN